MYNYVFEWHVWFQWKKYWYLNKHLKEKKIVPLKLNFMVFSYVFFLHVIKLKITKKWIKKNIRGNGSRQWF